MQTVTGPVWLLAVLGGLAAIGFVAVCWVAAGWAERAADWWHGRGAKDEVCARCFCSVWPGEISSWPEEIRATWQEKQWCAECQIGDGWPPLPPERTWEQMTSNQLPLAAERERIAPSLLGSRQAIAHFRRLEKARRRRFMVVSAEIWRAYAAVGLEGTGFTRAMAARVRELTP